MAIVWLLVVVVGCVAVQAFFAASEIAMVAADEAKVGAARELGRKEAVLAGLLERRDRLLALLLTGANLAAVVAAAALTSFMYDLGPHLTYLAPFILAPVTLLLGESLPKLLALQRPLAFARFAARPLRFMATAVAPVLVAETMMSRWLRSMAGVSPDLQSVFLTREDLVRLIHRRTDESVTLKDAILPAERQMISRIFRFTHAEARKAMVPLVRIEAVSGDTTLAGVIEVVRAEGFSRIPVFHERVFNIVGVVHVFDLLQAPDLGRPVTDVMRPVSYFPESTPLDEVLVALQRTRQNLAVVVDEYGAAAGILTIEDLLEEVVGEIEDEYREREEFARVVNPRTIAASAQAAITELNERFGLKLPESDEYATIGGLMLERLGHIPKPGEQLKADGLTITVARSDARAVREVVLLLDRPLRSEYARRQ
jgi:magnesium and cobalt exporter, CNNM family